MGYKKIMFAVDCANDNEMQDVQAIAKELSETLQLKARDLIGFYPFLRQHKALLYTAFNTISREGKRGLYKLIPLLMKQM